VDYRSNTVTKHNGICTVLAVVGSDEVCWSVNIMNKKKLMNQIYAEIENEKKEATKTRIKDMVIELEMAKRTVNKLEERLDKYLDSKNEEDLIFEL
jgi:hypothetical protein